MAALSHLPPELVRAIFIEAEIDFSNFLISQSLLPYTLEALYTSVDIFTRKQCLQFYTAIVRQPHLGMAVKGFAASLARENDRRTRHHHVEGMLIALDAEDYDDDEEEDLDDTEGVESKFAGLRISPYDIAMHDPSQLKFTGELLLSLYERLPNLESFSTLSKVYYYPLLKLNDPPMSIFQKVKNVLIIIPDDCDWIEEYDMRTCKFLSRFPCVDRLSFEGNQFALPFDPENTDDTTRLPPRSWSMEEFSLSECNYFSPAITVLFTAFSHLKILTLEAQIFPNCFPDCLQLLPTTIEVLTISGGPSETCDPHSASSRYPAIDEALLHFPQLRHLHLSGRIVTKEFFEVLRTMTRLECLLLGFHIPLESTRLLRLVQSQPILKVLSLHICHCPKSPSASQDHRRPRWTKDFDRIQAKKLVKVARKKGIDLTHGNLVCAVKMCDPSDGHECLIVRQVLVRE